MPFARSENSLRLRLLRLLCDDAGERTYSTLDNATLAQRLEVGGREVIRALGDLEKAGLVKRVFLNRDKTVRLGVVLLSRRDHTRPAADTPETVALAVQELRALRPAAYEAQHRKRKLTARQEAFVEGIHAGFSRVEALKLAGYRPGTNTPNLLSDPRVAEACGLEPGRPRARKRRAVSVG